MLTLVLWCSSFTLIALSHKYTKHLIAKRMRLLFCVMVGLSFWTTSIYVAWLLGFELQVGTVQNGDMNKHWWLPSIVILWTVLTYHSAKNK